MLVLGPFLIGLLTDIAEVRNAAGSWLPLVALYIALSFAAFQLDGIFIGATRTADMRNAAFLSLALFLAAWWMLTPTFEVVGLWAAFFFYVVARACALMLYYPKLRRSIAA